MADDKDYSTQSKIIIARKEREIERTRETVEAMKNALHKMHKQMLRDEEVKSSISQEMIGGVKGNAPLSGILAKLKGVKSADSGINSPDLEDFGNADNAPTGLEDPYWSREE